MPRKKKTNRFSDNHKKKEPHVARSQSPTSQKEKEGEEEWGDGDLLIHSGVVRTFQVIFDDDEEEDSQLREAREAAANAANVLRNAFLCRPKWPAKWASRRVNGFVSSLPETSHAVSRRARQRLATAGLRVNASLGYAETSPQSFLGLLAAAARHRDYVDQGPQVQANRRGRLAGHFYDLGCGNGSNCLQAAIFHDFESIIGVEILPELYEEGCLACLDFYQDHMKDRLLRGPQPAATVRFYVGDFLSLNLYRPEPAVVFVHAVFFTPEMMGRLSLKLRYIPVTAIVITVGVPMPSTPVKPGSSYHITFTILERTTVTDGPCGAVSAYIQRRDMTETEKEELEEKSTSEAPLSQAGGM